MISDIFILTSFSNVFDVVLNMLAPSFRLSVYISHNINCLITTRHDGQCESLIDPQLNVVNGGRSSWLMQTIPVYMYRWLSRMCENLVLLINTSACSVLTLREPRAAYLFGKV